MRAISHQLRIRQERVVCTTSLSLMYHCSLSTVCNKLSSIIKFRSEISLQFSLVAITNYKIIHLSPRQTLDSQLISAFVMKRKCSGYDLNQFVLDGEMAPKRCVALSVQTWIQVHRHCFLQVTKSRRGRLEVGLLIPPTLNSRNNKNAQEMCAGTLLLSPTDITNIFEKSKENIRAVEYLTFLSYTHLSQETYYQV